MEYPQELRNIWADAWANHCWAVWRCVDARSQAALSRPSKRADAEARLAECIAVKEGTQARLTEARKRLQAAENLFYGKEKEDESNPSTST